MDEIGICFLGNVDSGKSTTLGVLLTDKPDNGNGESRSIVARHPHEVQSGKTSDIAYHSRIFGKNRITFVDLCGHERYFRTTLYGLSSFIPDCVIVCIDRYTPAYKMTKEHIGVLLRMGIPFVLCMTKIDMYPKENTESSLQQIKALITRASKKKFFEVKDTNDVPLSISAFKTRSVIPIFKISNTTLSGFEVFKEFLQNVPDMKSEWCNSSEYMVNRDYRIRGIGLVVCGRNGKTSLKVGDTVYVNSQNECVIKSIHNDHREFIPELPPNTRGCLNLRTSLKRIRYGSVISKEKVPLVSSIKARIHILSTHSTTITHGYLTYIHCGSVRQSATIRSDATVGSERSEGKKLYLRGGETVDISFDLKYPCYLEKNQRFFFREGKIIGEGMIL